MGAPDPAAHAAPRPGPGGSRVPLWMRLALAASLGLNLVIGGIVLGVTLRPDAARTVPLTALGLNYVVRNLPEEDRAPFVSAAEDLRRVIQPIRRALNEDRARIVAILRAESFDAEAMRTLLRAQAARLEEATIVSGDRLIDTLATLSPEARRRFADTAARPRDRVRLRGQRSEAAAAARTEAAPPPAATPAASAQAAPAEAAPAAPAEAAPAAD